MTPPLSNISTSMLSDTMVLWGLVFLAIACLGLSVAVVWLSRLYLTLKHDYTTLDAITQSNKNDIFGLCSAALSVNEHTGTIHDKLHEVKQQLSQISEKMSDLRQYEPIDANSPYNVDIRKIRDGASIDELMRQSEISYDEAALLIRLHGGKKPA
ncbi:MAG TPA: DUF2802 domain-containing protein [Methylococcaceae bacterium]|nr:DUF2802 domain-containing protein [Methylococcaceae bacterium]